MLREMTEGSSLRAGGGGVRQAAPATSLAQDAAGPDRRAALGAEEAAPNLRPTPLIRTPEGVPRYVDRCRSGIVGDGRRRRRLATWQKSFAPSNLLACRVRTRISGTSPPPSDGAMANSSDTAPSAGATTRIPPTSTISRASARSAPTARHRSPSDTEFPWRGADQPPSRNGARQSGGSKSGAKNIVPLAILSPRTSKMITIHQVDPSG